MHNRDPFNRLRKFTRRAFVSVLAACSPVAAAGDDDAVWSEYLAWLKGRVAGDLVGLESYRKALAAEGVPKPEVERRLKIVSQRSLKRPEAMRLWFNSMYGPPQRPGRTGLAHALSGGSRQRRPARRLARRLHGRGA
jgi:hypothetical protein